MATWKEAIETYQAAKNDLTIARRLAARLSANKARIETLKKLSAVESWWDKAFSILGKKVKEVGSFLSKIKKGKTEFEGVTGIQIGINSEYGYGAYPILGIAAIVVGGWTVAKIMQHLIAWRRDTANYRAYVEAASRGVDVKLPKMETEEDDPTKGGYGWLITGGIALALVGGGYILARKQKWI